MVGCAKDKIMYSFKTNTTNNYSKPIRVNNVYGDRKKEKKPKTNKKKYLEENIIAAINDKIIRDIKGGIEAKLSLDFLKIYVIYMETEPSTKFYCILNIFLKVMKLRSLERLDVSDVIPANV